MFTNSPEGHSTVREVIKAAADVHIPIGGVCVNAKSVVLSGERSTVAANHYNGFTELNKPIFYKQRTYTFYAKDPTAVVCKIKLNFMTSQLIFEIGASHNSNLKYTRTITIHESKAFLRFHSALYYMCFGTYQVDIDTKNKERKEQNFLNAITIQCLYIDEPKILISTLNNGYNAITVFFCDDTDNTYYDFLSELPAPKCIELTIDIANFVDREIRYVDYSNQL